MNIGRIIKDSFLNGWVHSSYYDGEDAIIIYEEYDFIIIRDRKGFAHLLDFHDNPSVKQSYIDKWCSAPDNY